MEGLSKKQLAKDKTFNTDLMATLHKDDLYNGRFNASATFGV